MNRKKSLQQVVYVVFLLAAIVVLPYNGTPRGTGSALKSATKIMRRMPRS